MKLFYSDSFAFPLPPGHRFPLDKYALLRQKLLSSGLIAQQDLIIPEPASKTQLGRVHSSDYLDRVLNGTLDEREIRRIGLPWSPELVQRSRRSVGGTIAAALRAVEEGAAFNLAGGTHHAHSSWGSGFCVFNDVAIAARELQQSRQAEKVLVIDCDVHQGDGTAAIFHADDSVFTFSIHGEHNFPFRKSPGDLDVGLDDGCGDEPYLLALEQALESIFSKLDGFDLAFYLAGADPYQHDSFGRLALSKEGLQRRDRLVFETLLEKRLPVTIVLAGGYARDVLDTVDIHANTVHEALWYEHQWKKRSR